MMKDKPWTPAALKEVGGTAGIGVTFLEETFSATTAPPEHRYHQVAARAVLKALLPDSGADLKGHMRSYGDLLAVSGYSDRPRDFDDLIHILDSELRLITPTDPEGTTTANPATASAAARWYQLTHDYLVQSLRDWLTRKQRETRRGRAELRLTECAGLWDSTQDNRLLPSLWEYLSILSLTRKSQWTAPQQKMMRKAGRMHGTRCAIVAAALIAVTLCGVVISRRIEEKRQADYAASLVRRLMAAEISEVPEIVKEFDGYRRWTDPMLGQEVATSTGGTTHVQRPEKRLYASLALLPTDEAKVAELRDQLAVVSPSQFPVVRDALSTHRDQVTEPLWKVALDPKLDLQQRFQAACALATFAPHDARWKQIHKMVASHLVTLEASALVAWRETLRPAREQMIEPLAAIYRDAKQYEQARRFATDTLADYAADKPAELFELLADAEAFQFPTMFRRFQNHAERAIVLVGGEVDKFAPEGAPEEQKESQAKRQANCAVALFRLGRPEKVWPLLKFSPDPRVRSYLIHWLASLQAEPQPILRRFRNRDGRDDSPGAPARAGPIQRHPIAARRTRTLDREVACRLRARSRCRAARRGRMVAQDLGTVEAAPG